MLAHTDTTSPIRHVWAARNPSGGHRWLVRPLQLAGIAPVPRRQGEHQVAALPAFPFGHHVQVRVLVGIKVAAAIICGNRGSLVWLKHPSPL